MKAHYIRETNLDGSLGVLWIRVSRQEAESMKFEITSESRQDGEYVYLKDGCDVQAFYAEMMRGGRFFQGTFPHIIKLDGEEPTLEVLNGTSDVRNLEPVS